jgi:hypothetical protein
MEENGLGKKIGFYEKITGERYDCRFIRDQEIANAWGPMYPNSVGSGSCAYSVTAKSEGEAREKLAKEIGDGNWI